MSSGQGEDQGESMSDRKIDEVGASESEGTVDSPTDELRREVDAYRDKYLRAAAEMDNIRRRTERERSDLLKFAAESIAKDLLPVLDSLDKALSQQSAEDAAGSMAEGMRLIQQQLLAVLQRHGVEPIPAQGLPFDPNLHQAIQRVEVEDVAAEYVHTEYAKGYTIHGRLLRATIVSVAIPKS